jgi:ribosomal protein S18 acetylase RimI-like enzyme
MTLNRITPDDVDRLAGFLAALPEDDRTFFKEPIDPDTVERWCCDGHASRWLLLGPDGDPRAYLAIIPGVAWSAHVGELRLVVAPAHRRRGLGTALARHGLTEGVRLGLRKLIVDVVADKQGDIDMFTAIGFEAEALLRNHFRDREGGLHDLVVLSHDVAEVADDMAVVGLDRAVGLGGTP